MHGRQQLVPVLPDRKDPDAHVRGTGVCEGAEPFLHGGLAPGGEDVADVAGVPVLEQAPVVGEISASARMRLALATAVSTSSSRQRQAGTPATMRGAGRPAASAAR